MAGSEARRAELSALYCSYCRLLESLRQKQEHEEEQAQLDGAPLEPSGSAQSLSSAGTTAGAAAKSLAHAKKVQDSYLEMIKTVDGKGCISVRRVASVLIPSYAPHCPAALQSAVHVLKQLCQWCCVEFLCSPGEEDAPVLSSAATSSFSGLARLLSLAADCATAGAGTPGRAEGGDQGGPVPGYIGNTPAPIHFAGVARDAASFLLLCLQPQSRAGGAGAVPLDLPLSEPPAKRARRGGGEAGGEAEAGVLLELLEDASGTPEEGAPPRVPASLPLIIGRAVLEALSEQPEVVLGVAMESARGRENQRKTLGQHLLMEVTKPQQLSSTEQVNTKEHSPKAEQLEDPVGTSFAVKALRQRKASQEWFQGAMQQLRRQGGAEAMGAECWGRLEAVLAALRRQQAQTHGPLRNLSTETEEEAQRRRDDELIEKILQRRGKEETGAAAPSEPEGEKASAVPLGAVPALSRGAPLGSAAALPGIGRTSDGRVMDELHGVCLATRFLCLECVPRDISHVDMAELANKYGTLAGAGVFLLPGDPAAVGSPLPCVAVEMQSVHDAVALREGLEFRRHWGARVQVHFADPACLQAAFGVPREPVLHVWVGGIEGEEGSRAIMEAMEARSLPPSIALSNITRAHAMLLEFCSPHEALQTLAGLRAVAAEMADVASRKSSEQQRLADARRLAGLPSSTSERSVPRVPNQSPRAEPRAGSPWRRDGTEAGTWHKSASAAALEAEDASGLPEVRRSSSLPMGRRTQTRFDVPPAARRGTAREAPLPEDMESGEAQAGADPATRGHAEKPWAEGAQLVITRLDPGVSDNEILDSVGAFGEIAGWKFMRSRRMCVVDVPNLSAAEATRAALDGVIFGGTRIAIELRPITAPRRPSLFDVPPPRTGQSSPGGAPPPASPSMPTNTLLLFTPLPQGSCPRSAPQAAMRSEREIHALFSAAAAAVGSVMDVYTVKSARGVSRYVVFDSLASAAAALRNLRRNSHFEPSVVLEFSRIPDNAAIELASPSSSAPAEGLSRAAEEEDDDVIMDEEDMGVEPEEENRVAEEEGVRGWSTGDGHEVVGRKDVARAQGSPLHPPHFSAPALAAALAPDAAALSGPASVEETANSGPQNLSAGVAASASQGGKHPSPSPQVPTSPAPGLTTSPASGQKFLLLKSSVLYCSLFAFQYRSPLCSYTSGRHEPLGWPERLDVTKRADLRSVRNTYESTAVNHREVCILFPVEGSRGQGFYSFVDYLKQRQRAGVVKVSAYASTTSSVRVWPRLLHILPLTADNCDLIGLEDLSRLVPPQGFPVAPVSGDIKGLLAILLPLNPLRGDQ